MSEAEGRVQQELSLDAKSLIPADGTPAPEPTSRESRPRDPEGTQPSGERQSLRETEIMVPEQAVFYTYQGNMLAAADLLQDAITMYQMALDTFCQYHNGCLFTTAFERDVTTAIVRYCYATKALDDTIRYADKVIKGQPYDRYDRYAQECLYYRGQAYEGNGDMRNAYVDVIDLLRFRPRLPGLLQRSQLLKQIIQSCYAPPPSARAIQQKVPLKEKRKEKEKPATEKQPVVSNTVETPESSGVTPTETSDSVKHTRKSKNQKAKKKRKKNKKKSITQGTSGTNATQDSAQAVCPQQVTVVRQEEDGESSNDSTDDHQQDSSVTDSAKSIDTKKKTSENSSEIVESSSRSDKVQSQERSPSAQKPKEVVKDTSPVKKEIQPRGLFGSKPKRSSKHIAELQQKRDEKIQKSVDHHQALAFKEREEREQKRKKTAITVTKKNTTDVGTAHGGNSTDRKQQIEKTLEVVPQPVEEQYKGIPGKEPKYKSRQKTDVKLPAIIKLPRVVVSANPSRMRRVHLPVLMTDGRRRQLVITDPEPSVLPSTATADEITGVTNAKKKENKAIADDIYRELEEAVNRIIHSVLEPQDRVASQPGFAFSDAVLKRGKEVCSVCYRTNHHQIVEKDRVIHTCPVHRNTAWKPMLVWPAKRERALPSFVPIRARPPSIIVHFVICRYRSHCYLADACPYPHSEEELEAWTLDRDAEKWKFRQPKKLRLCDTFSMFKRCPAADRCLYAHGESELAEWRKRKNLYYKRLKEQDAGIRDARPLRTVIAEKLQYVKKDNARELQDVIAFQFPGVELSCSPGGIEYITSRAGATSATYSRTFRFTLKYSSETSGSLRRATFIQNNQCFSFSPSLDYQTVKDGSNILLAPSTVRPVSHVVEVEFTSQTERSFQQDIVFDFGCKPYVIKTLRVEIGSSEELTLIKKFQETMKETSQHWTFDSEDLCRKYMGPSRFTADTSHDMFELPEEQELMSMIQRALDDAELSSDNYKSRFHTFLYVEEVARIAALNRVNREGLIMEVRQHPEGKLGEIDLGHRPPSNSANSAFIRFKDRTVYELRISKTLGERISLLLPPQFLIDRNMKTGSSVTVDFQLAFDRTHFVHLHQAIDYISSRDISGRLIATQRNKQSCKLDLRLEVPRVSGLNDEQMLAVERILCQQGTLPVIVNGPFGTGKTHLLAEAVRLIIRRSATSRVLICTQSNHAADLYIEKMDGFIKEGAIFSLHRIYYRHYDCNRIYSPIYHVVRQYCHFENDQFIMPDGETLLQNSPLVIVTTLVTSMQLKRLNLPESFFTHIIIDEAAQATEPETVAAVSLVGQKTVVVMAGDHKQINPPIYSPVARMGKLHYSLFRRLYKDMSTVLNLKVDLVVNYRCHYDILNISSHLFYHAGKVDSSNALGPSDKHPIFQPVSFFATSNTQSKQQGEDGSYYNPKEAQTVVRQVEKILDNWPSEWGSYKDNDLCVITTEKWQARYIRTLLRTCSKRVEVLTSAVVQGRQFRGCVISTVLTQDGYEERNNTEDRDFLSNAKLLNTSMTRAQSLVLVVGDPLCLCTCGKLTQLWIQYIAYCRDNDSYHHGGMSYKDFQLHLGVLNAKLNPESPAFTPSSAEAIRYSLRVNDSKVTERKTKNKTSVWDHPRLAVVSGDDSDDDMVEEYRRQVARKKIERDHLQLPVSSKATVVESRRGYEWRVIDSTVDDTAKYETTVKYEKHLRGKALFEAMQRGPTKFFRCRLSVIDDDEAIAVVQKRPDVEITIRGWKRRNRSFDGEEVLVRLDEPLVSEQKTTQPLQGTVVGTFQEERPKEWVCVLSKREENLLLPLDKTFPPIINLPRSVEENGVAIFNKLSKEDRERSIEPINFVPVEDAGDKIFIVQYLKWRIDCMRPLGVVVAFQQVGITVDAGMELLSRQYLPTGMVSDCLSRQAEEEASKISSFGSDSSGNVVDNVFTIDSLQSTDLDDALSFVGDLDTGECCVGVYIADVTQFVRPGSPLDLHARSLGTTYYDHSGVRRHNMLPDRLSSDLCSLLPGKDRPAIQILFTFDRDANVVTTNFKRCIVRSRSKMCYEEVEKIIEGGTPLTVDSGLIDGIRSLYKLSVRLRRKRLPGNRWHLRNTETSKSPRSQSMVEEFMLLANKTIAEKLMNRCRSLTPLVVQGSPDVSKLKDWAKAFSPYLDASCSLREIAQSVGLDSQTPMSDYATIAVSKSQWRDIQLAVTTKRGSSLRQHLLLSLCTESFYPQLAIAHAGYHRCLQRSLYVCADHHDDAIIGHKQLDFRHYTHFTSPIRRYVDIIVHRLLTSHVMGLSKENLSMEEIQQICCHCSRTRVLAQRYQKETDLLSIGCRAQSESLLMTAVVRSVSSGTIELYFPDCRNLGGKQMEIRVSSLNPVDTTLRDEGTLAVIWSIRVVGHPLAGGRQLTNKRLPHESYFSVPVGQWKKLLLSVLSETSTHDGITRLVREAEDSAEIPHVLCDTYEIEPVDSDAEDRPVSCSIVADSVPAIADNVGGLDGTNMPPSDDIYVRATKAKYSSTSAGILNLPSDVGHTPDPKFSDSSTDEEDDQPSQRITVVKKRASGKQIRYEEGNESSGTSQNANPRPATRISQEYRTGSLLSVQLSSRLRRGILRPIVQLIRLPGKGSPSVCLEHYSRPGECFVDRLPHGHVASKDFYNDFTEYRNAWLPVIDHESAVTSVKDSPQILLVNSTAIRWRKPTQSCHSVRGEMEITLPFIRKHKLGCIPGDFVCLRYTDIAVDRGAMAVVSGGKQDSSVTVNDIEMSDGSHTRLQWVSHCRIVHRIEKDEENRDDDTIKRINLELETTGERQHLPDFLFSSSGVVYTCSVQFIGLSLPFTRMRKALSVQEPSAVVAKLCLGEFSEVTFGSHYEGETSEEARKILSVPKLLSHSNQPLNRNQFIAVKLAMKQDITLIQGPPGTGKTITGAHIVIEFLKQQTKKRQGLNKHQVMYCCPSNQTVDDVTERLKRALSPERMLRVYSELIEKNRFPGPSIFEQFASSTTKRMTVDSKSHKDVALHYRIRDKTRSMNAIDIRKMEQRFRRMKENKQVPTESDVRAYDEMVKKADREQIRNADVVLCTCIEAGSWRMTQNTTSLCIVDEAGQSLEPETLVAISKAERVVLIGDHKQLRPVVQNAQVQDQLSRSMFERIAESKKVKKEDRVHMLTVQYRMHNDICLFPSKHFYSNKLTTAPEVQKRPSKGGLFWNHLYGGRSSSHKERRKCFVHVVGEEQINPVAVKGKGGEESKYNKKEADIVVM
jgi:exoribonuclease R/superfamily I DNA and/or RNA helicase